MIITETTKPQDRTFQLTVTNQELTLLHSLFGKLSESQAGLDTHPAWVAMGLALCGNGSLPCSIQFNSITRKI